VFLARHHQRGDIDRVVLDECHEILINSEFRPRIAMYAEIMDQISPRQVYMTGTLPPSEMDEFLTRIHLPQDVTTIRSLCTPRNMRFEYVDEKVDGDFLRQIYWSIQRVWARPTAR
jgi:hypothetical protein